MLEQRTKLNAALKATGGPAGPVTSPITTETRPPVELAGCATDPAHGSRRDLCAPHLLHSGNLRRPHPVCFGMGSQLARNSGHSSTNVTIDSADFVQALISSTQRANITGTS